MKRQLPSSEDGRFVIRQSIYAECLELWTYASFQEEVEFLQKNLNPYNIEDRKLLRKLTDGNIIELDTNDRLLIPAEQKSYIKNAKDIVLTATGNFIEIWDYEKYTRMNGEETDYANLVNNRLGVKTNNETI